MVTSVTVVLNGRLLEDWGPSGATHAAPRLVHPTQTDLPPPRTAFIDKLLADGICCDKVVRRTQFKCELYVITNALLAKRLHVYKWRIDEEEKANGPSPGRVYHNEVTHFVLVDL
ncbi:hypothetical protein AAVH_27323 [Aphelenchoides avenae]|nr:hypothetical protein AAVH_27323 [Aphelenchus avenae]